MHARLAALICLKLLLVGPAGGLDALSVEMPRSAPRIPGENWKDCYYNDQLIGCLDQQAPDQLIILWIDGVRTQLNLRPPARPGLPSYWGDRYGGLWRRELLPQGNNIFTNLGTGNRILIPLRYPCRPPLKGEVGYCYE